MLTTKVIQKWISSTLITAIIAACILSLFANIQFLRPLYNVLIGLGPIVAGYPLYRHADIKKPAD
jgi:hypothetical protein